MPHARGGLAPARSRLRPRPSAASRRRALRARPFGPQGSKGPQVCPDNSFPRSSPAYRSKFQKSVSRSPVFRVVRASYNIIISGRTRASPPEECTHGRPPGGRPCCVPGMCLSRAPARVGPRPRGRGQSGPRGLPVSAATPLQVPAAGRVRILNFYGNRPIWYCFTGAVTTRMFMGSTPFASSHKSCVIPACICTANVCRDMLKWNKPVKGNAGHPSVK